MSKELLLQNFERVSVDDFDIENPLMRHEPRQIRERMAMDWVKEAVNRNVKDFYAPKLAPSLTSDGRICFQAGLMPAAGDAFKWSYKDGKIEQSMDKIYRWEYDNGVLLPAYGRTYEWWNDYARLYMPEYNSRIGTRLQYGAFIGHLAMKLFNEGMSVEQVWHQLSVNSNELGHFRGSLGAQNVFEVTGSRTICGFSDLGNVSKLLATDENVQGHWIAGGHYRTSGKENPITSYRLNRRDKADYRAAIGWIICSESSENYNI